MAYWVHETISDVIINAKDSKDICTRQSSYYGSFLYSVFIIIIIIIIFVL